MSDLSRLQMRDAFIERLFERAKEDRDILFIANDFGAPSLDRFRAELPGQYINAGIAEQNIISVAAGLAMAGKKVFVYSIASFITLRCLEQIKLDLCCHQLPVTILGVGACYAYPEDGPTHHASEDISIMRSLVGLSLYSPADAQTAQELVDVALEQNAPSYIRLDKVAGITLGPGQDGLRVFGSGQDFCLLATGVMVHRALEVAQRLRDAGHGVTVVDLYRLKPLNSAALLALLPAFKRLVTLEEHTIHGGLGSVIAEFVVDHRLSLPLQRLAIADDHLYGYGSRSRLHQLAGLDCDSIETAIRDWGEQ
ncbi:MAG: transketolase [Desulfuromonadaceae bacterium]|nr:transketolase [Desulfuromonadaceae bacterium]